MYTEETHAIPVRKHATPTESLFVFICKASAVTQKNFVTIENSQSSFETVPPYIASRIACEVLKITTYIYTN